jgi:methionyl-tRNA formyltransferase
VGEFASGAYGLSSVPLIETNAASSDDAVLALKREVPVDFSFVVDFGQLIKEPLLAWEERVGCLNIHPSRLPLYRGAAPIQRALMDGADAIGISVFKLAHRMDSGPILLSVDMPVGPGDDFGSLRMKAAEAGVGAFVNFATALPVDSWEFEPQDESLATYAPKISPDEERVDWNRDACRVVRRVRALSPKPGAWTTLRGRRMRILSAREASVPEGAGKYSPGELCLDCGDPKVATRDGFVELVSVQMEGKKPQPAPAWRNGLRIGPGECLI